jgi:hypothetical protein
MKTHILKEKTKRTLIVNSWKDEEEEALFVGNNETQF